MTAFQKILIVGARSKLTAPLVANLSSQTTQILLHSRHPLTGSFGKNIVCLEGDFGLCEDAISGCECIIYLAGVTGYGPNLSKSWSFFYENNILPLTRLLSLISTERLRKFIYLSSTDVFNYHADQVINEQTTPAPKNLYGLSKYFAEMCVSSYFGAQNIDYSIVRPGPIYGGGDTNQYGLSKLFADLATHKPVNVYNPSSEIGLLSVNEVSQCVATLIKKDIKIANLLGSSASLREFVGQFSKIVKSQSDIRWHGDEKPVKLNFDRQMTHKLLDKYPEIVFAKAALELQKFVQKRELNK